MFKPEHIYRLFSITLKPLKASAIKGFSVLRGHDSNMRPLGYEPNELPTAPPRGL